MKSSNLSKITQLGKGGSQTQTVTLASIHLISALSVSTDTNNESFRNELPKMLPNQKPSFLSKAHVKENS